MTILEMISEWRNGCSCGLYNPADCRDCTVALIDAIEKKLNKQNEPFPGDGVAGSDCDIGTCNDGIWL